MADLTTIIGEGAFDGTVRNQINANFTALNAGGGGLFHQAKLTLDNADIIALPTGNGLTIVEAQGANTMIFPVFAVFDADFSGGAYTNVGDFCAAYLSSAEFVTTLIPGQPLFGNATTLTRSVIAGITIPDQTTFTNFLGAAPNPDPNAPLRVSAATDNGLAFGDGHADNTMTVSVIYTVLNTSTGLFE